MSTSYRTGIGLIEERAHSYIWIILLPAAAECVANVWYPSLSLMGIDMQLAALNISGEVDI